MAIIGIFRPDKDGYTGAIRTLSLTAKVRIIANDRKSTEGSPDFRVFAGPCEIGAAWRKTAKDGDTSYLSIRIDDPMFPEPIRAALLQQAEDGVLRLAWRREKREEA